MAGEAPGGSDAREPLIDPEEFRRFTGSLQIMLRVILAVVLREARTRYGKSELGYAWAIIDPLVEMAVLMLVFTALGRQSPIAVPLPVFLLTGLIPFQFFKDCVGRGASAANANIALLTYPQVKLLDVLVGRVLLEAITTAFVYLFFAIILHYALAVPLSLWYDDVPAMIGAMLGLLYFGMASAIFSCSINRLTPVWSTIWSFISRPLWFLSGVFYTISHLPNNARYYMIYNPIAHLIEWWRSVSLPVFSSDAYSITFVLMTATVIMFIGLAVDRLLNLIGYADEPMGG